MGSFQVKTLQALGLLRQLCVFPLLLLFHFGVCGYCGRPLGGIFSILETPERPHGLKMSPQAKECNIDFGLTANKKIKKIKGPLLSECSCSGTFSDRQVKINPTYMTDKTGCRSHFLPSKT